MGSTLDMDTTIKGLEINRVEIERIINEILAVDIDDNIYFKLKDIKNIHDVNNYDDFRISLEAQFYSIKVNMKINITTDDQIIPREILYSFKLMFEERSIPIKAYNLNTILAEKIESILARNIANTRARDYYDIYVLHRLRNEEINYCELRNAIYKKAEERNTLIYIDQWEIYLNQIEDSGYLNEIWTAYKKKFQYAEDIDFYESTAIIRKIFQTTDI